MNVALSGRSARMVWGLYEPADGFLVRAPLRSVDEYLRTASANRVGIAAEPTQDGSRSLLPTDPVIQTALLIGSPTLFDALHRTSSRDSDTSKAARKLLRYQVRMASRPTPYGLFAGVAMGQWGRETTLSLGSGPARTYTRPDMGWLLRLVSDLEERPEILRHLRVMANPTAFERAGRVFLADREPMDNATADPMRVSIRGTGAVLTALELSRVPISYELLASRLCDAIRGADRGKVDRLLEQLRRSSMLLTELRPPLTLASPVEHVIDRLQSIDAAADLVSDLRGLLKQMRDWDEGPSALTPGPCRKLMSAARAIAPAGADSPIQVDMALRLNGECVSAAVGSEVVRAAEVLLRLSPLPQGIPILERYRQAFIARYGESQEVPVTTLIDESFGLGPPHKFTPMAGGTAGRPRGGVRRDEVLLRLAYSTGRTHSLEVELSSQNLLDLESSPMSYDDLPPSLDLNVMVAARSVKALDAGDFRVVVGPSVGANAGGRHIGRFAYLLGKSAIDVLHRTAAAEEAQTPDVIWAELVHTPRKLRSANVAIRPHVRSHEIRLGTHPSQHGPVPIRVSDLVVGIRRGRFYVRWLATGSDVIITSGTMLNPLYSDPISRSLLDLGRDGQRLLHEFDWGAAESLPFLPRVRLGRIVLRPAQWRLGHAALGAVGTGDSAFTAAMDAWRQVWCVPRHVFLCEGDNRLLIDLDDPSQLEQLRADFRRASQERPTVLQEVLPGLDELWLTGPGGRFAVELSVTLARKSTVTTQGSKPAAYAHKVTNPQVGGGPARLYPPGSEWVYAKLYIPRELHDDVISGPLRKVVQELSDLDPMDDWHFLRYADPDPHLRFRVRARERLAADGAFRKICDMARDLVSAGACQRLSFDTYDREIERYGGPDGSLVAEAVFTADSEAMMCALPILLDSPALPRLIVAAVATDELLDGLGIDPVARPEWYRTAAARHDGGAEYRAFKSVLRSYFGADRAGRLRGELGKIAALLEVRRRHLEPARAKLIELEQGGRLNRPLTMICRSFVHMSSNRLGLDPADEARLLGLLARTSTGLVKSQ